MSDQNTEPSTGFTAFRLSPPLNRGIAAAGFVEPRPIQTQTIPATLDGRDVLGLAQTGTGKTAAFALPILERLLAKPGSGPRILILVPTRELATQIATEIRLLAGFTQIKVATVFGGVSAQPQRAALRMRPEILVACPGRLLDLIEQGAARLDRVETLVLDEADHMFDIGFLPDVRRIISMLPKRRQNLLFAATMPKEVRGLADQLLRDPHVAELKHSTPAPTIEHALYSTEDTLKLRLLQRLLTDDQVTSVIVFTRTKRRASRLAQQLSRSGRRAVALQGNMSQNQRDRAMSGFRKRQFDILVATDIAARGIDVERVSHVVNFDMPGTPDAYTHRIGRTGRAEREGKAYTFVTAADDALVRAVESRIGSRISRRTVELPAVAATAGRPRTPGAGGSARRRRNRFNSPARANKRAVNVAGGPAIRGESSCGSC